MAETLRGVMGLMTRMVELRMKKIHLAMILQHSSKAEMGCLTFQKRKQAPRDTCPDSRSMAGAES